LQGPSRILTAGMARLRRWLRGDPLAHVALAVVAGALAGAAVTAMSYAAEAAHVAIYGIAFDERLSARAKVPLWVAFASLTLGGLAMGMFDLWRRRRRLDGIVDPIEANALRGGRLSLRDGLVVVAQTLLSNGCGASVGLEAGYAQIGSAIASRLGLWVRLRRQDLRMMVGCGAAGAIAAAFGAPLTGAFYAFELIIGAYTLLTAAPVIAAAVAGALVVQALGGAPYVIHAPLVHALGVEAHFALVGLGLVAAALGVAAMRAAAVIERGFQASPLPPWARPVVGGAIVAAFAAYTPQALGAGHGALDLDIGLPLDGLRLTTLILIKLAACLISLASGFRGGLFFASLFVGALLGKLYALALAAALPGFAIDPAACIFAGMATLGVAIVGGPLTMAFLVLESTGDLPVAGGVLAACIATSLTVRMTFGYSFSTWRLHLRGETIRGAQDIGWRRELTVARLMDRDPALARAEATVAEFRALHPLGSAHYVALEDSVGRYAGLVAVPEAYADEDPEAHAISDLARLADVTLSPEMGTKEALALFEASQSEILAVADPASGALLGTLGEAYAARRYAEALALAARGVLDDG
jgi:chloride channel protein, CIC family